jgi:hypothetical protein
LSARPAQWRTAAADAGRRTPPAGRRTAGPRTPAGGHPRPRAADTASIGHQQPDTAEVRSRPGVDPGSPPARHRVRMAGRITRHNDTT